MAKRHRVIAIVLLVVMGMVVSNQAVLGASAPRVAYVSDGDVQPESIGTIVFLIVLTAVTVNNVITYYKMYRMLREYEEDQDGEKVMVKEEVVEGSMGKIGCPGCSRYHGDLSFTPRHFNWDGSVVSYFVCCNRCYHTFPL
jgi:hypothetical protein